RYFTHHPGQYKPKGADLGGEDVLVIQRDACCVLVVRHIGYPFPPAIDLLWNKCSILYTHSGMESAPHSVTHRRAEPVTRGTEPFAARDRIYQRMGTIVPWIHR